MASNTQAVETSNTTTTTSNTTANTTQQALVRKRRRRLTTNGAPDDCFACQKRRIRCDRQRPYCTQCLDQGNNCSGYKTTLTWGVGVASRGKLRGRSLPIANPNEKVTQSTTKQETTSKSTRQQPTSDTGMKRDETFNFGLAGPTPAVSPMMSAASFPGSAPIPIPTAMNNHGWALPTFQRTHSLDETITFKRQSKPAPLQRTMSYSPNSFDDGIFSAPSTASLSNFSESDFPSPHELPPTPPEMPCNEPLINGNIFLNGGSESLDFGSNFPVETSPSLSFNNDVHLNFNLENFDSQCLSGIYSTSTSTAEISPATAFADEYGSLVPLGSSPSFSNTSSSTPTITMRETEISQSANRNGNSPHTVVVSNSDASGWSTTTPTASAPPAPTPTPPVIPQGIAPGSGLSNLSPRTAYLVDYYSNSICPVLVAVDGPNNPYRVHILALASASGPALVNAVAALASNVLHLRSTKNTAPCGSPIPACSAHRGVSEEALRYKAASVNLYNAALRDPAAAYDDSILATLVVLTLFEISESGGVANLKSQMAEIRQILTLRGSNSSQFLHWATMFFTWLDVMKATVSDRERQVRTGSLDLFDFSANLGALEHLSFCEGRMFKVLARMGSGSRTRRASSVVYSSSTPNGWTHPAAGIMVQESRSRRPSINPFTGLPIASTMGSSPAVSSDIVPTIDSIAHSASVSANLAAASPRPSSADARQEFWSEWAHVRSRLRIWSSGDPFSSSSSASGTSTPALSNSSSPNVAPSTSSGVEPSESTLVTHASEIFCHAALLFAERLAFPELSANSGQIQALVSGALHHLSSIPLTDTTGSSGLNKVLLWPLCIIGTECVRPGDRDVIRLRCGEAMREQGVFGGCSGIEVLERLWAAEDAGINMNIPSSAWEDCELSGMPLLSSLGGQAEKWKRAMLMGSTTPVQVPVSLNMQMSVTAPVSVPGSWGMNDLTAFC